MAKSKKRFSEKGLALGSNPEITQFRPQFFVLDPRSLHIPRSFLRV